MGQKEDVLTRSKGEWHQRIYRGWRVCGTDVRQEGMQLTERNEGGEEEAEMGEDVEEEPVRTEMKGKNLRKGKERAKEKTSEGEEGEEEGESKGEGVVATTTIEAMDTFCNDTIFGYCRVNLFEPPAPLKFGEFNR